MFFRLFTLIGSAGLVAGGIAYGVHWIGQNAVDKRELAELQKSLKAAHVSRQESEQAALDHAERADTLEAQLQALKNRPTEHRSEDECNAHCSLRWQ